MEDEKNVGQRFVTGLLQWNRADNQRQMPWKGEKDPYKIWLSEVILQQTRVEQGLKYFQNFIAAFPDINALAAAPDEKVFKLWEGLGYYSRCRNLIKTAKYISGECHGIFPATYSNLLALKGVGSYTAAAIASFAYNLPHAVVDGNVFRVLSRIYLLNTPIDSTTGKKQFSDLAQSILPKNQPAEYNQAIMDFGATVCKPAPLCEQCFFQQQCLAYKQGAQLLLPVKGKKTAITRRWLNYFVLQCSGEVLIQQRVEKDIWQSLYQFLLIETKKVCTSKELLNLVAKTFNLTNFTLKWEEKSEQLLSHQRIYFHLLYVELSHKQEINGYQWVKLSHLPTLPFPKTLQQAVIRHIK